MDSKNLRQKYLEFFQKKGHQIITSASLIPQGKVNLVGTQKVLFTTAGMHPLIPYLLGESHSKGSRLASVQKCLRTDDIDEVGDNIHHTFFEMLGNWSLGDYWKKEAIEWSFEFLTSQTWLGIEKNRLAISVFAGDQDAPFDQDSFDIWRALGIPDERISRLPKKNNWWGPAGEVGPCGPDTEMFIWTGTKEAPENFDPENHSWVEVWNDVFMEYNKTPQGRFEPLKQKNVDTGMGLERMIAVLNGTDDDYRTDLFWPIIERMEEISGIKYQERQKEFRIIADHLKAAVFLAQEGLEPGNKQHGYVMRRLIRRAVVKMRQLDIVPLKAIPKLCQEVTDIYGGLYFDKKSYELHPIIGTEADEFLIALDKWVLKGGVKLLQNPTAFDGKLAFDLYQTNGFPWEVIADLFEQQGKLINRQKIQAEFNVEFEKHQELSRTAAAGMFKGGLADQSEQVIKYHTATHLLQAALRQILGVHVQQKGSNTTTERLRFDFTHPQKMTAEEINSVEDLVNQKIKENLPVKMEVLSLDEALKTGALGFFGAKYDQSAVKVYSIGDFSKEICGGPHMDFTGALGSFKIEKEESVAKGVRRIYGTLS